MLRDIIERIDESKPRVSRNDKPGSWDMESEVRNAISKKGATICGIGLLEKFFKKREDKVFTFTYLFENEKQKGDEFDSLAKNHSEKLVRYASRATIAGGMMPLCILNADKGYMRFMENIDEDPDLEDAQWSKPQFFNYLRTIY